MIKKQKTISKPKLPENINKIDAVFEGGGVKGSALVGAVAYAESLGYVFENLAGTSAGAIMAALLAAGYTSQEIKSHLDEINYSEFKDTNLLGKIPVLGPAYNLIVHDGIYKGDFFLQWIRKLLADKGVRTFGNLVIPENKNDPRYKYKLQVVASDISRGKLLILPEDAKSYKINPDTLDVGLAIRMSMSIPYFFQPVILKGSKRFYVVDGGILSNFPVWLFDDGTANPAWPTIGFKLVDPKEATPHPIHGPITLFGALFSTMMEAHDARYIEDSNFVRTIPIPTLGVHTTDFGITKKAKQDLYNSGFEAASKFFKTWDFEDYKKKYRRHKPQHRTDRVWKS